MTASEASGTIWLFPAAVLLAAVIVCFLILWGGEHVVALALPALGGPHSAAVDETIGTLIIFGLLLVAGLAGGAVCNVNAVRLGDGAGVKLAQGAAIGLIGLLVGTALAAIAGVLRNSTGGTSAGLLLWGTALIFLQAGSEEVFFRGWLQPVLVRAWGLWGVPVTAIAFAGLHLVGSANSAISVLNLFLGGLLFGLLAYRYGGITAAVAAHFSYNWAEQLLFGIDPNPGVGSFGSIFNFELIGSSWWGGSNEGLNASIAMTFALTMVLAPLFIVPARGRPPQLAQNQSDPAPA
jgi:hypothetical protein